MPLSMTLLRIVALTAAIIAGQSAIGVVRAADATAPAPETSVADTTAVAELRGGSGNSYDQLQPSIPKEIELVTGDGQQASASTGSIACDDLKTACKP